MEVWACGGMGVWRYARVEVCACGGMRVWRYRGVGDLAPIPRPLPNREGVPELPPAHRTGIRKRDRIALYERSPFHCLSRPFGT